ncbi:MAG: hypothetical protein ABI345_08220, partial [Jatrophihabitans sp.]
MSDLPHDDDGRNDPAPIGDALPSRHGQQPDLPHRLITHNEILDLIVRDTPLPKILLVVTAMIEREIPLSRASILLVDAEGRLHPVAAPS